ncbi:MAG: methyltransferase domain-containing protein [Deltaproteobacteria bacterium]|jgi:ubiquinone/menaquinone biosynthesis C-methylase UbiE|nr:methyltransferase domain-containing protein [Deltaproteobacteria bacterium]
MSEEMSKFNQVDKTATPDEFIRFLDMASGLDWVKAGKQKSFALLKLKPGQRILEVGCGTGEDARTLAEKVQPGGEVIAIDTSREMIAEARKRALRESLNIDFKVGNVTSLDFDSNSFDRCHIERTLIHNFDPRKALQEMIRVLRVGGLIVAFEGDLDSNILDSSEPKLTRKILRFWCDSFQSPHIGRQLPAMYKMAGLLEISVQPHTFIFDFSLTEQVLISGTIERAGEAGVVTSGEADRWLSDLKQARDSGTFFFAGTGFIVSGRKA